MGLTPDVSTLRGSGPKPTRGVHNLYRNTPRRGDENPLVAVGRRFPDRWPGRRQTSPAAARALSMAKPSLVPPAPTTSGATPGR